MQVPREKLLELRAGIDGLKDSYTEYAEQDKAFARLMDKNGLPQAALRANERANLYRVFVGLVDVLGRKVEGILEP